VLRSELLGLLRQGRDILLTVDVQGAATIRAQARAESPLQRALVTVFLAPPTMKELEARLRKRNKDPVGSIRKRLSTARQEIAQWEDFDYVIVSQTAEEDVRRMLAIVEAEKMRQQRVRMPDYDHE
jgi:guanylate kinase